MVILKWLIVNLFLGSSSSQNHPKGFNREAKVSSSATTQNEMKKGIILPMESLVLEKFNRKCEKLLILCNNDSYTLFKEQFS